LLTVLLLLGGLTTLGATQLPDRPSILDVLAVGLPVLAFPTVGAIVASRRPENPIGWIFCVIGLSLIAGVATGEYVLYARHAAPSLPAVAVVAWIGDWAWVVGLGLAGTLMLLLFPDGRPPSPRWRVVGWLAIVLIGGTVLAYALRPGPLDVDPGIRNPFGIPGPIGDVASAITGLWGWPMVVLIVASLSGFVTRFARARGDERQQLKWVAYATGIAAVGFTGAGLSAALGREQEPYAVWFWFLLLLGLGLIPVAAGIAILRYRLYDIDLLINRTLVYGGLSATLAALYVGLVISLQGVLSGFTGGNSVAVAASTLAVAGLFQPVRRRIQAAVDRRFYRSRYDTARTLEAFSSGLRSEVDLAHLSEQLRSVVAETLQPASVSVWVRRTR
jgi:hypothetical protein